jgi:hypothetical protein
MKPENVGIEKRKDYNNVREALEDYLGHLYWEQPLDYALGKNAVIVTTYWRNGVHQAIEVSPSIYLPFVFIYNNQLMNIKVLG